MSSRRTPKKTETRDPGYVLSRKNYLQSASVNIVRPDREYVYVLFTNTGLSKTSDVPFHVGSTPGFSSELKDVHEFIWHERTFRSPAVMHVIASVPQEIARFAVQGTIEALHGQGYLLNHSDENGFQLQDMPYADIISYIQNHNGLSAVPVLTELIAEWRKEESQIAAEINYAAETQGSLTSQDLHRKVTERSYSSSQAKSLARILANAYNPETGRSEHVFRLSPEENRVKKERTILALIKGLKGDWFMEFPPPLIFNSPTSFKPSEALLLHPLQTKKKASSSLPVTDRSAS
jgi:hypothetical protein